MVIAQYWSTGSRYLYISTYIERFYKSRKLLVLSDLEMLTSITLSDNATRKVIVKACIFEVCLTKQSLARTETHL